MLEEPQPVEAGVSHKTSKSGLRLVVAAVTVLILALGYLGWYSRTRHATGIIAEEPARTILDPYVYSVAELSSKFASDPGYFKTREVKVKALSIGAVPGIGCGDYAVAGDLSAADTEINLMPDTLPDRPSIKTVNVGDYGIYTGHFFDKSWISSCDKPDMFVTTGYEKIAISLPAIPKETTVSSGYIIYKGSALHSPYHIALNGDTITVNNVTYETTTSDSPLHNAVIESSFDNLVTSLERGDLEIVFSKNADGEYSRVIPNRDGKPQTIMAAADSAMHGNGTRQEKKDRLISIFELSNYDAQYVDDMLDNWDNQNP